MPPIYQAKDFMRQLRHYKRFVHVRRPNGRRKNNRFELRFMSLLDEINTTKRERATNVIDSYTSVGDLKITSLGTDTL